MEILGLYLNRFKQEQDFISIAKNKFSQSNGTLSEQKLSSLSLVVLLTQ